MARSTAARAVTGYARHYPLAPRYRAATHLSLRTADGVAISADALAGPADAPASVVLVHGFANSSRTPAVHHFAHVLARRVPVVVPDLRGHGRSGGECTMGRCEHLDVDAAVRAARILRPELPVVTVGTSLGAAAVLVHAATERGIAGVVAISAPGRWGPFDSDGTRRVQRWVAGPAGRMVLAAFLRTRVSSDFGGVPDAASQIAAIAPAFTIIAHDPDDWYFPADHARLLHEWAKPPKALWWYPGGGHGTDLLTPAFAARLLAEIAVRCGTTETT